MSDIFLKVGAHRIDELDAKVKRKEWWMNGTEAVELGFADGFTEAK